jgi:hypothetical protein
MPCPFSAGHDQAGEDLPASGTAQRRSWSMDAPVGHDVERLALRELLGPTGQFAAVDELLTGRENLEMFGRPGPAPAAGGAGSTSRRAC